MFNWLKRLFGPEPERDNEIWGPIQQILRNTEKIMTTQAQFDAQMAQLNKALVDIQVAIEAETKQLQDFISSHEGIDTSALNDVIANLEKVDEQIATIVPASPEDGEHIE